MEPLVWGLNPFEPIVDAYTIGLEYLWTGNTVVLPQDGFVTELEETRTDAQMEGWTASLYRACCSWSSISR